MAIEKFKAEHMMEVLEKGVKEFGIKAQGNDELWELAQRREANGLCLTGIINNKAIACGGIDIMWTGVGEVWLLLTPEVDLYPVAVLEDIGIGLKKIIEDNKLHRVQAFGRIGFHKAHVLFKYLDFKAENDGIARKYTPDKCDCLMYAKVT